MSIIFKYKWTFFFQNGGNHYMHDIRRNHKWKKNQYISAWKLYVTYILYKQDSNTITRGGRLQYVWSFISLKLNTLKKLKSGTDISKMAEYKAPDSAYPMETPVQQYTHQFPFWVSRNQSRGYCPCAIIKPAILEPVGKVVDSYNSATTKQTM